MTKEETKEKILDIMEYLDNGECEFDGVLYKGHPGFYHFHTKEEMLVKLEEFLDKDAYDRYDLYYIVQKLIKFLLSKYDSHTKLYFLNYIELPFNLKVINGKVYIEKISDVLEHLVGGELIAINNVPVERLINEVEEMTCYSTQGYLDYSVKTKLSLYNDVKALPSIDSKVKELIYTIKYNGQIKNLTFSEDNSLYNFNSCKQNYVYKLSDNVMILTYSACKDFDKMKEFVRKVKQVSEENNINNFIIDIRDNRGGNSEVIKPLLEFLEGKNIVTLVNETTFSSARTAFVDLKNLGSYSIGTCISTSLNCFGNNTRHKKYDELGLAATGSSKYFYYDRNLRPTSVTGKEEFEKFVDGREELLEPFILYPDEIVDITLEDIKNGTDSQLEAALNYLSKVNKDARRI